VKGGVVSRTFGRWHAVGPYAYVERGGFMLHLWFRYFRLPWQHGLRWGYTLRICGRYVLFGGRR
jgi:hypothetical protein